MLVRRDRRRFGLRLRTEAALITVMGSGCLFPEPEARFADNLHFEPGLAACETASLSEKWRDRCGG